MPLIEGNTIAMNDSGSHHLSKVLRKSAGDPVILFNGTGGEYHGLIEAITPKSVQVSLDFFVEPDRAAPLHLHLGQVMGKGDHMDYALQKSVPQRRTPDQKNGTVATSSDQRLRAKRAQYRADSESAIALAAMG